MRHWAWIIILVSSATVFMAYGIRFGYSVLLPEMLKDITLSKTDAGLIFSAYMLGYTLFSPIAGLLSDRLGGRIVVSCFCMMMGLGAALMGTITTLSSGIAFFSIAGCGASALWVSNVTLIQGWFTQGWRGKALGIINISTGLGYGITSMMLPITVFKWGWRIGWYLLGVISIFIGLINLILLRSNPEDVGLRPWGPPEIHEETRHQKRLVYESFLRTPTFWLILLSYFSVGFSTYIFMTFIVTFAYAELSLPYTVSSILMTLIALGGVTGSIILSAASDRIGRKITLIICNASVSLSTITLLLARTSVMMVVASTIAYGFFHDAVYPVYAACSSEYFSTHISGTVLGLWTLGYGIAAFLSPLIGGYLADVYKTFHWTLSIAALFSGVSIAPLIVMQRNTRMTVN